MLEMSRIRAGHWEAVSRDQTAPTWEVRHLDQPVAGLSVAGKPGDWKITLPIPAELLSDGVQTFVVHNQDSPEIVAQFSIVAGEPLAEDLRAEIELLRAELDLLKRAFRQHCAQAEG